MFKDVSQIKQDEVICITVDDKPIQVPTGYTVTAALLSEGYFSHRSSAVSNEPRGPYCLMGVCFECLVEIDGTPNQQGCMTPVAEGMSIKLQNKPNAHQLDEPLC